MTAEDGDHKVSLDESQARQQRKKRKWDQPAEFLPTTGLPFPFITGNAVPVETAPIPLSLFVSNGVNASQVPPLSGVMLQTATALPKSNQPKAQEELIIAREIIINDADPAVRYKLTKRQTQEEIQRSTGAVVTTRGKYRPPNALPDGEKPLYLHISAGSHLKETVERIVAVDRAAASIEDMLKQCLNSQHGGGYLATGDGVKASQALSLYVYLGFDINPAWNIASRIRGPNDQYINHIMNETGASVSLRGRGSGIPGLDGEEGQQPLHLFLSSTNPKSLENAKNLAEHLLDTIGGEFGVSRMSSTKLYAVVPPPQPLVTGALKIANDLRTSITPIGMPSVALVPTPAALPICIPGPGVNLTPILGTASSSGVLLSNGVQTLPSTLPSSQPSVAGGTRYNGYEGIYPRATPLQQVALVLKHSTTASTSTAHTVTSLVSIPSASQSTAANVGCEKDKRHAHRRKFQELPVMANEPPATNQDSQVLKSGEPEVERDGGSISGMLPPKKSGPMIRDAMPSLSPPKGMPPPPTKCMPPPPPPPKSMPPPPPPKSMLPPPPPRFTTSESTNEGLVKSRNPENKVSEPIPDTLIKLMEYGEEEDDDIDEVSEEPLVQATNAAMTRKPFWSV